MDLVRNILLMLEARQNINGTGKMEIEGYDRNTISYHVKLAWQAGLIEAEEIGSQDYWHAENLTWEGHEFLETARNETLWLNAKKTIADTGAGVTIEVLKGVLIYQANELLKKVGIEL